MLEIKQFFIIFEYPTTIVTDNGPPFSGELFQRFCVIKNIQLLHSPPYYLDSNGLVDKSVQTIKRDLDKK